MTDKTTNPGAGSGGNRHDCESVPEQIGTHVAPSAISAGSGQTTLPPRPPNWLRRRCPACGLWVTGLVNEGAPVAAHGCEAPPEITPEAAVAWLEESARYFAKRDTHGEDAAHWANIYNAENATRIAALIQRLT